MDDLKLLGKARGHIDFLVQTIHTISEGTGMKLRIKK